MKHKFIIFLCAAMHLSVNGIAKITKTKANLVDKKKLEKIFNIKPELFLDEGVVKISYPRNDIKAVVDNYSIDPFLGVTSWFSFKKGIKPGVEAMVMGDFALLAHEVNPAIDIALKHDIEITALHNHFFWDDPKLYFMHIGGEGDMNTIASGIQAIIEKTKELRTSSMPSSSGSIRVEKSSITPKPIEKILTVTGQAKDGMLKLVIGREVQAGCGCTMGKNMGVNTSIAFGGTDDNAVVDGDLCLLESELQPVIKALRQANINIVAIHSHMVFEKPRLLFLHYWGRGKATDLAQGLKNVLDKTALFKTEEKSN